MNIDNKMYVESDTACNLSSEDKRNETKGKYAEPCLRLSDAVRIAKEYAEEMCKKQRNICTIVSLPVSIKTVARLLIRDCIADAALATDKDGE